MVSLIDFSWLKIIPNWRNIDIDCTIRNQKWRKWPGSTHSSHGDAPSRFPTTKISYCCASGVLPEFSLLLSVPGGLLSHSRSCPPLHGKHTMMVQWWYNDLFILAKHETTLMGLSSSRFLWLPLKHSCLHLSCTLCLIMLPSSLFHRYWSQGSSLIIILNPKLYFINEVCLYHLMGIGQELIFIPLTSIHPVHLFRQCANERLTRPGNKGIKWLMYPWTE